MNDVGIYRNWLVEARLQRHLTQGEVAKRCGVSRSAYQKYEYGLRTPSRSRQTLLEKVLSMPSASIEAALMEEREEYLC